MERDARLLCLEGLHAQSPLEAVNPGLIFFIRLCVDLALLFLAARLYDRWRRDASSTPPSSPWLASQDSA